jgi:hypothetical protein
MSVSGGWKSKCLKGFTGRDSKTYVASGALSLNVDLAILDGSDAKCEMTLADGEEGQRILIVCVDSTKACDVTPDSFTDGTDLTFTADEMAELVYVNGSWLAVGGYTAELDAS